MTVEKTKWFKWITLAEIRDGEFWFNHDSINPFVIS